MIKLNYLQDRPALLVAQSKFTGWVRKIPETGNYLRSSPCKLREKIKKVLIGG